MFKAEFRRLIHNDLHHDCKSYQLHAIIGRPVPLLKPNRDRTVNMGRMTTLKKKSPHPWPRSKTRSYRAYQATQTPLFSNTLMLPFDTQVCHEYQICFTFRWIMKVILEITFSDLKVDSNFDDNYWQSCTKTHLILPPGPAMSDGALQRGLIVQWDMKACSR